MPTCLRLRIPAIESLAVPAVCTLITFLAYTSQYLFHHIDPGPLSLSETLWFNVSVAALWWTYYLACTVDPGPKGWTERFTTHEEGKNGEVKLEKGMRWCKKCEAIKPPRAHHCKKCKRCIPKMDHHCPWTSNCVSHTTLPYFTRFLVYTFVSLSILTYHLFTRALGIWNTRNLPAYLGPSIWALSHLLILVVLDSFTLFAISILIIQTMYNLFTNTTTIEGWEIERHESLVARARKQGGWVYANGGLRIRVVAQQFPYDIGNWKNLVQAMGTPNIFLWLLPFGGGPTVDSAGSFEVNGFEDEDKMWPPPDPDKMPGRARRVPDSPHSMPEYGTPEEEREAFKRRQEQDMKRWKKDNDEDDIYIEYEEDDEDERDEGDDYGEEIYEYEEGIDGEVGWTNSDGDRLRDYGVDEDAEGTDEDDIPLGELLRRQKARAFEAL